MLELLKNLNRQDALTHISDKTNGNKLFFDKGKNRWICYGFNECKTLLSNGQLSKSRLNVPNNLLGEHYVGKVQLFKDLLNNSIIFGNKGSSAYYAQLYKIFKTIDLYTPAIECISSINRCEFKSGIDLFNKIINKYNTKISNNIFNITDESLSGMARSVGRFFDGKVNDVQQFREVVDDLIKLFYEFRDIIINDGLLIKHNINDVVSLDKFCIDCTIIYLASLDTTAHLICHTIDMMINNKLSLTDYNLDDLLWESVRLLSPITSIGRLCVNEILYEDKVLKPGESVLFLVGLANYDKNIFTDPFTCNLKRVIKPLSFGVAHSQCLGLNLSMMMSKIFLKSFCSAFDIGRLSILSKEYSIGVNAIGINKLIVIER